MIYATINLKDSGTEYTAQSTLYPLYFDENREIALPTSAELVSYGNKYDSGLQDIAVGVNYIGRTFLGVAQSLFNETHIAPIVNPDGIDIETITCLSGSANLEVNGNTLYTFIYDGTTETTTGNGQLSIPNTAFSVVYTYTVRYTSTFSATPTTRTNTVTYNVSGINNRTRIKPYTIKDCVNRVLRLCKPLKDGQTPEYVFDSDQATKYDKILAPEFTLTQCSLREQLDKIGSYIHSKVRLVKRNNQKVILFDSLDATETATINGDKLADMPYVENNYSQSIDNYCSQVDTTAENVANTINYAQGSTIELQKTLRLTETTYARITDGTGIAETQLPIYSLLKVMCGIYNDGGSWYLKPVDITPFIVEQTIYNANMSSYDGEFPQSKAYALYYTIGEKNIKGLWFKYENITDTGSIFNRYSIINILNKYGAGIDINDIKYPNITFQITYIPLYNTRFKHSKPLEIANAPKRTLFYNQSENIIETSYYGENVKSAVLRLGNVDNNRTYFFTSLNEIPKVNTIFKDNYRISCVNVQIYTNYIKCTIELSEYFNRKSEYIGINSNKRVYQVSERQAYNRNEVYENTVYLSINQPPIKNVSFKPQFYDGIVDLFNANSNNSSLQAIKNNQYLVGSVYSYFSNGTDKETPFKITELPVVSSAFGNVMTFSWRYKDSFSAGQKVENVTNGEITGSFSQDVAYKDYYGRGYYYTYGFSQLHGNNSLNSSRLLPETTLNVNDFNYSTVLLQERRVVDIESVEILGVNSQIEFKTTDENLIIGSGLASVMPFINDYSNETPEFEFLILDFEINALNKNILEYNVNIDNLPRYEVSAYQDNDRIFITALYDEETPLVSGKSFVCIKKVKNAPDKLYFDSYNGETVAISSVTGGEILFGYNGNIGTEIEPTIYLSNKE